MQTRSNEKGVDKSIKARKILYKCDEKKRERERERVTTETVVVVKHEDVSRKKMRLGCLLVTTRVNSVALLKLYK